MQTVVSGVYPVKRLTDSYHARLRTPKADTGRPFHTQPGAAHFRASVQATAGPNLNLKRGDAASREQCLST